MRAGGGSGRRGGIGSDGRRIGSVVRGKVLVADDAKEVAATENGVVNGG